MSASKFDEDVYIEEWTFRQQVVVKCSCYFSYVEIQMAEDRDNFFTSR